MDWSKTTFQLRDIAGRKPINHFVRFCLSRHTRDLVGISLGAIFLAIAIASVAAHSSIKLEVWASVITALLGVVAWAYQAANIRFGSADLFAGEIGALCRIAAVAELTDHLAKQYYFDGGWPVPTHDPGEYFTAYNNNAKDMEVLDGDVVEAVGQFYGNIKVFRDILLQPAGSKEQQLTAIYYGFLAFESARYALAVLIDDTERSQEAVLAAMVSELRAYVLLLVELSNHPDDPRLEFLKQRFGHYCALIDAIDKNQPKGFRGLVLARQVLDFWRECVHDQAVQLPAAWRLPTTPVNPACGGARRR